MIAAGAAAGFARRCCETRSGPFDQVSLSPLGRAGAGSLAVPHPICHLCWHCLQRTTSERPVSAWLESYASMTSNLSYARHSPHTAWLGESLGARQQLRELPPSEDRRAIPRWLRPARERSHSRSTSRNSIVSSAIAVIKRLRSPVTRYAWLSIELPLVPLAKAALAERIFDAHGHLAKLKQSSLCRAPNERQCEKLPCWIIRRRRRPQSPARFSVRALRRAGVVHRVQSPAIVGPVAAYAIAERRRAAPGRLETQVAKPDA